MRKRVKRACFHCRQTGVKTRRRGKRYFFYCPHCKKTLMRFFELAGPTKVKKTSHGPMHYSAGALIIKNGKYLIGKRAMYPFVYNVIGGHVDKGETMTGALIREVREETGLAIHRKKLLFRGVIHPDRCTRGVDIHYWNLFLVESKGKVVINRRESQSLRWMSVSQMARIKFNPPVRHIFRKINFMKQASVFDIKR